MTLSGDRPIPADVFLNGRKVGQSPLFLEGIKEGRYLVEARKEGFGKSARRALVKAGRVNRVVLILSR